MITRKANLGDIECLVELSEKMHKEGSYKHIIMNMTKTKSFFIYHINAKNSLFMILVKDDRIIGFFIAEIVSYFFSDEQMAIDHLFYIDKSYRKSSGALRLLNEYFSWTEQYEIKEICLSSTNGIEMNKIEKMYLKLDFKKAGIMYKKEI